MTKTFICVILCLSLMIPFASAADFYEVQNDTQVRILPSDYPISPLDFSDADSGVLEACRLLLQNIWNDLRTGFGFVDDSILAGNTLLSQINVSSNSIYTLLDGMDSTLDYVLQGVGQTNGYFSITNSRLSDLISTVGVGNGYLLMPSGNYYLNHVGSLQEAVVDQPVWSYVANGFMGLDSDLDSLNQRLSSVFVLPIGNYYLNHLGQLQEVTDYDQPVWAYFSNMALGMRSLIAGSESDNVYQGFSIDNENESTAFTATGLGPMLNTWLGNIQNDLGLLSYVFASPQDLELKSKSADNMTAVGDSLLSSDSSSSIKVSNITDISDASVAIQGFGDTGVTPGQAFAQLGNSNLFRFFSAECAADLDTTISTFSRDPGTQIVTNYYEDSRSEFFKIIAGEGDD